MVIGFGPCAVFYLAYLLGDESSTAITPIQLPEEERLVVSMFTNSQTFSVTSNPANVLVIRSGLNELLTLTAKH